MRNIKFNYLYRDSAIFKNFNSVIFKNDLSINIEELESLIKSNLIYGEWFYAEQWKLPELFLSFFDYEIDPPWHEFESVEYSDEAANASVLISEFIHMIEKSKP